jgi:hypothetical protein
MPSPISPVTAMRILRFFPLPRLGLTPKAKLLHCKLPKENLYATLSLQHFLIAVYAHLIPVVTTIISAQDIQIEKGHVDDKILEISLSRPSV